MGASAGAHTTTEAVEFEAADGRVADDDLWADPDDSCEGEDDASALESTRGEARDGLLAAAGTVFDREQELALVVAAQGGDMAARDALVRASHRNITWIARRYRGSGVPLEDLVNEGAIGVLTAIDRFDASRGTRFETYARWWVLDALRNCVLLQSRTVRLPANVVREIGSIDRLMKSAEGSDEGAQRERNRNSVINRVAQQLRRTGSHVEEMLALKEPNLPMEALAERAHEDSVGDGSPRASAWSPESTAAMKQILRHLGELMEQALSERERKVIVARYGLETGVPASLEELGALLGLTAERVRQVQNEATVKLRAKFIQRRLLSAPAPGSTPAGGRARK